MPHASLVVALFGLVSTLLVVTTTAQPHSLQDETSVATDNDLRYINIELIYEQYCNRTIVDSRKEVHAIIAYDSECTDAGTLCKVSL